jgi:glycosyltransferase involved in cell wall biosynthesis
VKAAALAHAHERSSPGAVYADHAAARSTTGRRQVAVVLWNGDVGGAEVVSLSIAQGLRELGAEATMVFVEQPQPLAARLPDTGVSFRELGFDRGSDVLRHPRTYASEVARVGSGGALLLECGFMAAGLRLGGYRGPIVAVEHGAILKEQDHPRLRGSARRLARRAGARAADAEVAVSNFILERLREGPHADTLRRIYNGIDPAAFVASERAEGHSGEECVIAFAARLIPGKGADYLIDAFGRLPSGSRARLVIAGDGPERGRLEALARAVGCERSVEFAGLVHDMPGFWGAADVAVIPSAEFIEACGMTTLEAMAAAKPVVATRNGGLPELVLDGETGSLVASADAEALAAALSRYVEDPGLRASHGARGRKRVLERFDIAATARAYLGLFEEVRRAHA